MNNPVLSATPDDFEFAALAEARNYRIAIAKLFAPHLHGDVLEVGAGVGQMLQTVAAVCRPRHLAAVEPEPKFFAALSRAVPSAEIWQGSECDIPGNRDFDAIYAINVLEHIEDDTGELRRWHTRLRPGAALCLLVPARRELYSPIDKEFGHYRRYTKRGLRAKLAQAGFASADVSYFNFAGYFAWLLNFRILRRRKFDLASVRLFDRIIFPASNFVEEKSGLCPLGQSLVVVAKA